ncbi:MAG: hypothetical protein L6461_05230 [Anaerolineae bacterium]|nr:hypothetical protein [Anaerolineae bacterium]
MAAKPGPKNWDDIKMMLTTISITATLGFWNVFAAANEQNIVAKEVEQPASPAPGVIQALVAASPTPVFTGKILLGGKAPSQVVIAVQQKAAAKNNQQPQQQAQQQPVPVTQTQSS